MEDALRERREELVTRCANHRNCRRQDVWIGFNDQRVESQFEWSDGATKSFTKWNSGEPNNYGGGEDCTHSDDLCASHATNAPTASPTAAPSDQPTSSPSDAPTDQPTSAPTNAPTAAPSKSPVHPLATVSGDPFTEDKDGNKVQFWLPLQQETQLLECGRLGLLGRPISTGISGDHQQWFDKFTLFVDGKEAASVETKIKGSWNYSVAVAQHAQVSPVMTSLDVIIAGKKCTAIDEYELNALLVDITQNRTSHIGRGFSETAYIALDDTKLQVRSATASKFASDTLQVMHAHLDLRFLALDSNTCSAGVLAEIWGIVPMSRATEKMLETPQ